LGGVGPAFDDGVGNNGTGDHRHWRCRSRNLGGGTAKHSRNDGDSNSTIQACHSTKGGLRTESQGQWQGNDTGSEATKKITLQVTEVESKGISHESKQLYT
jgi:hypothetical protein